MLKLLRGPVKASKAGDGTTQQTESPHLRGRSRLRLAAVGSCLVKNGGALWLWNLPIFKHHFKSHCVGQTKHISKMDTSKGHQFGNSAPRSLSLLLTGRGTGHGEKRYLGLAQILYRAEQAAAARWHLLGPVFQEKPIANDLSIFPPSLKTRLVKTQS